MSRGRFPIRYTGRMASYQHISHGFEPVFDERSRILVLGSFPSVLSRENAFYYGNPQNRFWQVLAALTGAPVPQTIPEKQTLLLGHGIALWDTIASCEITGSSDSSIKNAVPTDINTVLSAANIKGIFCNGATSHKLYMKYCYPNTKVEAVKLPSTSPANAAFSL